MKNEKDTVHLKRLAIILLVTFIIAIVVMTIKYNLNTTEVAEEIQENEVLEVASIERGEATSRSGEDLREKVETEDAESVESIEEVEEEMVAEETENYISIEDVTISVDMDLTVRTGLSKEDFKTLMGNCKYDTSGFFYENAELIYDICKEYELNEIFFCGLISAESGWNIASNHRAKHNYISMMNSSGVMKTYSTLEEGLEAAAKLLHNSYLTPGGSFYYGKTLSAVKTKFCPSSTWVSLVYGRMKQII